MLSYVGSTSKKHLHSAKLSGSFWLIQWYNVDIVSYLWPGVKICLSFEMIDESVFSRDVQNEEIVKKLRAK